MGRTENIKQSYSNNGSGLYMINKSDYDFLLGQSQQLENMMQEEYPSYSSNNPDDKISNIDYVSLAGEIFVPLSNANPALLQQVQQVIKEHSFMKMDLDQLTERANAYFLPGSVVPPIPDVEEHTKSFRTIDAKMKEAADKLKDTE